VRKLRNKRIPVSLYILVPLIFTGIAIISSLVTYHATIYHLHRGSAAILNIFLWVAITIIACLICSYIVIARILNPVVKFITTSEEILAADSSEPKSSRLDKANPAYYTEVFDKITDILGKMEARELFPRIIGQSIGMRDLFGKILKVAPTDTTVLIMGESGTGKELIATAVYEHSRRKGLPFIKLNCVAIPEGLLESELFGHEKGAFTGAVARKTGKFELADGGTIFLDEIGDMPQATQAKLLRTLQEKEIERVGGNGPIKVDVRFIAATNKNLEALVKEGKFREDLYFRLCAFPITIPALRDRREDIPLLSQYFLAADRKLASAALQMLLGYSWPGNVRELQNVLARAEVLAGIDGDIAIAHLPAHIQQYFPAATIADPDLNTIDERLHSIEKGLIIEALGQTRGIQARAAELLGINQRSLWHRIKKFNIDVESLKNG
jgi:transcriptional regulator with GAF, ATPase, and Fis domain